MDDTQTQTSQASRTPPGSGIAQKACARCVYFMPSVKEQPGRGLCSLYSLVMNQADSCRYGFQARVIRTRIPASRVPA